MTDDQKLAFRPTLNLGAGCFYGRVQTEERGPHQLGEVCWIMSFGFFPHDNSTAVLAMLNIMTAADCYGCMPIFIDPMTAEHVGKGGELPVNSVDGTELVHMPFQYRKDARLTGPYEQMLSGPGIQ